MGSLLGGFVLTETVFSWSGIGVYVVDKAIIAIGIVSIPQQDNRDGYSALFNHQKLL